MRPRSAPRRNSTSRARASSVKQRDVPAQEPDRPAQARVIVLARAPLELDAHPRAGRALLQRCRSCLRRVRRRRRPDRAARPPGLRPGTTRTAADPHRRSSARAPAARRRASARVRRSDGCVRRGEPATSVSSASSLHALAADLELGAGRQPVAELVGLVIDVARAASATLAGSRAPPGRHRAEPRACARAASCPRRSHGPQERVRRARATTRRGAPGRARRPCLASTSDARPPPASLAACSASRPAAAACSAAAISCSCDLRSPRSASPASASSDASRARSCSTLAPTAAAASAVRAVAGARIVLGTCAPFAARRPAPGGTRRVLAAAPAERCQLAPESLGADQLAAGGAVGGERVAHRRQPCLVLGTRQAMLARVGERTLARLRQLCWRVPPSPPARPTSRLPRAAPRRGRVRAARTPRTAGASSGIAGPPRRSRVEAAVQLDRAGFERSVALLDAPPALARARRAGGRGSRRGRRCR